MLLDSRMLNSLNRTKYNMNIYVRFERTET